MSFIQRELDRVSAALRENQNTDDREVLYASQQALSWATDPDNFKSPMALIKGTQAETEDCQPCHDPGPFVHIQCQPN